MRLETAGQTMRLCVQIRLWLWLVSMLLCGHLSPELHAIGIKGLEGERVDIGKGIECADTMADGRIEVAECRVDVGRALFLDEAMVRGRVETRVEVFLEDTGTDGLFVKDGRVEDVAATRERGVGCLGSEDGDRRDECGVDGSDADTTETAPKGTVAEPGRCGKVLLCIWGNDGRGR